MTRWTERQRAMLEAMGLRLWTPDGAAGAGAGDAAGVEAEAAASTDEELSVAAGPARALVGDGMARLRQAAGRSPAAPSIGLDGAPSAWLAAAPLPVASADAAVVAAAPSLRAGAPSPADPVMTTVPPVAGVASMDWTALERQVAGCIACPLSKRRTHTVFGTGHHEAHWMFIGEGPGEQEDLSGEPFVGASGRLLDRMLAALGLTREAAPPERQVYIANTVKCRPPGNRNPEPAELAACEGYLARQIALVRPRVIVALGRVAAHWLLKTGEPLGRLRGRLHRYQGVPLVVTYHPAYLLRQAEDKARSWDDLCFAREVVADAAMPLAVAAARRDGAPGP